VDGAVNHTWYTDALQVNYYVSASKNIGALSSGSHTLKIQTDTTGVIAESNESNNQISKAVTVGSTSKPDLYAYELTSTPTSPNQDSSITVAWKVKNQGSANVGVRFYTKLYVDGAVNHTWYTDALQVNYYVSASKNIGTLSPGTHTLKIQTDTTGVIAESSESNNQISKTVTVGNTGKPDLYAYELTTTPTSPNQDSSITVAWKVKNQGSTSASGRFYTKLYVDGAVNHTWYTDGLKPSNYVQASKNIGTLSPGTHTLKIQTDTTGVVAESSESNNQISRTVTVGNTGKPDLYAYELTYTPTSPNQSSSITLAWKVKNQGSTAAGGRFYTKLYVDGAVKHTWYTDGLQANYQVSASKDVGTLSPGIHVAVIKTDTTNVIPESNELNNEKSRPVTVGNTSKPDLYAYELTYTPTSPNQGSSITATWKVKNQGSADIGGRFYTKLYVDGAVKHTWYTVGLQANYFVSASKDVGTLSAGTHTFKVQTDTTGVIAESNESNNQISRTVTVGNTSKPDLFVYHVSYTPTSPTVHNDITVTWRVRNQGSGDVNSRFYTTLYVDGTQKQSWYTDELKANYYVYAAKNIGKLSTGSHTLMVVADSTGTIPESDENNNATSKKPLVGGSGKPDIYAYHLSCDPSAPGPNTSVKVVWRMKNQGTADITQRFHSTLHLDGTLKQTWNTDELLMGRGASGTKSLGALGSGTHTIKIVTDANGVIDESNENNNMLQLVTKPPSGKPDLYVSHLEYTPSDPESDSDITLTWKVKNQGTKDITTKFYTRLFVDDKEGSWDTDGLKANQEASDSQNIGKLSAGPHTVKVVTDFTSAVDESDESNNEKTAEITVGGDLKVPDIRVEPFEKELFADDFTPLRLGANVVTPDEGPMRFTTLMQADAMALTCTFPPDSVELSKLGEYTRVALEDGVLPEDRPGTPWLPAKYINVLIPAGTRVTNIAAKANEELIAKDITVYPVQPPVPLSRPDLAKWHAADRAAYAVDSRVPESFAVLMGHNALREHTMVAVRLNPVRYNPATKELYLATTIRLVLQHERGVQPLALAPNMSDPMFDDMVRDMVVNPQTVGAKAFRASPRNPERALNDNPVRYLVITSQGLSGAFRQLAGYRHLASGLSTGLVTVASIRANYAGKDDQAKIRACIKDHYENRGTRYVVLGGDDTVVPDRDCFVTCGKRAETNMPTDLYYADMNGNWDADGDGRYGEADYSGSLDEGDLAPEVLVGRIPVRTAQQVKDYVSKLEWFSGRSLSPHNDGKMLMCGVELLTNYTGNARPIDATEDGLSQFTGHSPVSDAEVWGRRLHRDGVFPHWKPDTLGVFYDTLTSWDGGTAGDYQLDSGRMSTRLNEGWLHLFFGTHGNPSGWALESGFFRSSDALNLTGFVPIVYTVACHTGKFDSEPYPFGAPDPCLSEAFLRVTLPPKDLIYGVRGRGAIAYFGCSRQGWGKRSDKKGGASYEYAYEFYDQVLHRKPRALGDAFARHKTAKIGDAGSNGAYRWVMFGMNYQGDPAIGTDLKEGEGEGFTIHNDGHAPLEVESVTETATWLKLKTTGLSKIYPGGYYEMEVFVDGSAVPAGGDTAEVVIRSNDPDENPVTVKVVIHGANRKPTVTARQPASDLNFVKPNEPVALNVKASDPDGDALSYAWYVNDSPARATGGNLQFSAADKDRGPNVIRVEITDSHGQTTTTTWQMLVGEGDPDLVGYWPMDEEKGRDWSGWGNDLNVKGSVDFTWDGVHGKALKLSE
jgi:subtilase family serine protease